MAYSVVGLACFNTGGSIADGTPVNRMWHYITNDDDDTVETDAYFDSTGMRAGDLVFCSLDMDGTDEVKIYVVSVGTGLSDGANDVTIVSMKIS